jgi:hypothetical protein
MLEWFVDDVLDDLGSRKEVEYAFRILDEGTSADRQLAVFRRTGDLKAVVDQIIVETEEGVLPANRRVSKELPAEVAAGSDGAFMAPPPA